MQSTYILAVALCALGGVAGMRALGESMGLALAEEAHARHGAHRPQQRDAAALPVVQAGLGAAVRHFAELTPAPHLPSPAQVPGAVFDADAVRVLRDAAHLGWKENAGLVPAGTARRDASRRFVVARVGGLDVEVLPTPRLGTPEAERLLAAPDMPRGELERLGQERASLRARLDEALDASFALGHLGRPDAAHVRLLGAHEKGLAEAFGRSFRPGGVWSMIVHGSPFDFQLRRAHAAVPGQAARLEVERLAPEAVARRLREAGYVQGESVMLVSCSAGACAAREAAAQRLADELGGPVVAPSTVHFVDAESSALYTKDKHVSLAGEWRLFRPRAWDEFPAAERVVLGRAPLDGETALAKVNDLWRVPGGSAKRIELAGPWVHWMGENDAALLAVAHALAPDGRLVMRTTVGDAPMEHLTNTLEQVGLRLLRGHNADDRGGGVTLLVAVKQ